jgi:dephospho-CoA kinase
MTESSAWRVRVDRVLVVDCSTQTQIERVMLRNGWSRQTVEDIIQQQATRQRRRRIADAVIFNDAIDRDRLRAEARLLWRLWVGPGQTAAGQDVGL